MPNQNQLYVCVCVCVCVCLLEPAKTWSHECASYLPRKNKLLFKKRSAEA